MVNVSIQATNQVRQCHWLDLWSCVLARGVPHRKEFAALPRKTPIPWHSRVIFSFAPTRPGGQKKRFRWRYLASPDNLITRLMWLNCDKFRVADCARLSRKGIRAFLSML